MNHHHRHVRPAVHSPHQHHGHSGSGVAQQTYVPPPPLSASVPRPRPPSMSRAPWDITQWSDPIQNRR